MIPFSPPHITDAAIAEVVSALKSGWITTGPRTRKLEEELNAYCNANATLCLNSATAGLELMLRWFGVKEGDEVILPAYTYAATANVVMHCGAKPVLVDVNAEDFNINIDAARKAVTERTKVIMPVDIGGWPCDYDALNALVEEVKSTSKPNHPNQQRLGRILVLSDAAHSLGATYNGKRTGTLADATVFSFHAVKNFTTAEGGAVCLNLPISFSTDDVVKALRTKALHGQNKDALAKTQKGNWEYDIVEAGYKWNMPDVLAAIGLASLKDYDETLQRRKQIVEQYDSFFRKQDWCEAPMFKTDDKQSCHHLYMLRLKNVSEQQRNAVIQKIFDREVSVNVHFKPLPLLSYYKGLGYNISDYPVAYDNYCREISLPVYFGLTDEQVETVCNAVKASVEEVLQPTAVR
ncbi:MAG TPA: DegT/DnrJ/EryC1/StrS family aminotransferase [Chitinophagales bacterium]|nr:DegT/DnrJ/EryC1/StrS family aminotransferase [Chitinophagales bacterium]